MKYKAVVVILVIGVGVVLYGLLKPTSQVEKKGRYIPQNIMHAVWPTNKAKSDISPKGSHDSYSQAHQSDPKEVKGSSLVGSAAEHVEREALFATRREKIEARKQYQKERYEWRRRLNKVLQQAKKDGDYSKYNMIKEMEPDKELFLK